MHSTYDLVIQLTSDVLPEPDRQRTLNDFAYEFGWQPSERYGGLSVSDFANAHLVVEHGLEYSAVITFLRPDWRYSNLENPKRKRLLGISYNNMVDWHIQVEREAVTVIFNRTDPPSIVERNYISRDNTGQLHSQAFEAIAGRRPNPNLPALDDALIETISLWKRNLSAEMGYAVSNENLSALFNAIILARAMEDQRQRFNDYKSSELLLQAWTSANPGGTVRDVLTQTISGLAGQDTPDFLVASELLSVFDHLDRQTVFGLIADFYRNKYAPYEYDFSLMSKHALSRIYEHYVSILRIDDTDQLPLPNLSPLPREELDKRYGSVYTPQFIARFFARYLREQVAPFSFKRMSAADPACGSGIFLRSLLELQCDPSQDGITTDLIEKSFSNVLGLDIDQNAAQATRLSLALLHLVLTNRLPEALNVHAVEAVTHFQSHPELQGMYDTVIANPPYVSLGTQSPQMREALNSFMEGSATGRIDAYLAFLRLGLEMLKPGGYGMFVLPHSFLIANSAARMRRLLAQSAWIRCIADLSAIRVFEDVGSYIVLLVFQKRTEYQQRAPRATVVKCDDFVGMALQAAVEGRQVSTSFYSVYDADQDAFKADKWLLLPPGESAVRRKFESLPTLDAFLEVREGFVSGADSIFIIRKQDVPKGESALFVPFLPDRDMELYTVPKKTDAYVFYPYMNGRKVAESDLRDKFKGTWDYLISHQAELEARKAVTNGHLLWWQPERPRQPEHMLRPKIVSPHLVLVPRFGLDQDGRYAISHSPFLYPKEAGSERDLLRFFLAVLNSTPCYWYIGVHSHKYRGGYAMLERKTLQTTRVPDPTRVPGGDLRRLLNLVDRRLLACASEALMIEKQIDALVADLYSLSATERASIGMGE